MPLTREALVAEDLLTEVLLDLDAVACAATKDERRAAVRSVLALTETLDAMKRRAAGAAPMEYAAARALRKKRRKKAQKQARKAAKAGE